jgi:hypothetical protein
MEAIATHGLAANILQFIDFGIKILSKGNELYTSADGTLMGKCHNRSRGQSPQGHPQSSTSLPNGSVCGYSKAAE